MKVFISWSGERSKAVGQLLDNWLQCVLQAIEPWMSSKDIDRGAFWFDEINNQLKDCTLGIICITNENKDKPWILFEAGALTKGLNSNRVCTFLIDLKPSDIKDPLAQFNHTLPDEDGLWALVRTLNTALGDNKLKEPILERVFKTYWPQFKTEFNEILKNTPDVSTTAKREEGDILGELLDITRSLDKKVRTLESNSTQHSYSNVKPRSTEGFTLSSDDMKKFMDLANKKINLPIIKLADSYNNSASEESAISIKDDTAAKK